MPSDRLNLAGHRALAGLAAALCCALGAAPRAHAAPVEEGIDDPKLARRLGTRMDWVSPPSAPSAPSAAAPAMPPPPISSPATLPPALPPPETPAALVAAAPTEPAFQPVLPRAQVALRRFDFVRIGASDSGGLAAPEAFDVLSIDVYPVSSLIRVGLSTAYGWQEGRTSGGDYSATETASFGLQLPVGHLVPFAEGLAGVGYMRRFQFQHNIPTVFWQLGVDVGAAAYFARVGFVSLAVGYLRPVNGFLKMTSFESVYTDTWSFKIGIGI
jgi:hypothetical protein